MVINQECAKYEDTRHLIQPIDVGFRQADSSSRGCTLHFHEALEFYYVRTGGIQLLCGGNREWLFPGDAGFVNWCQPHRGESFLDGTRHYIIRISSSLFESETVSGQNLLMLLVAGDFPGVIRNDRTCQQCLDTIIAEMEEKKAGYELKCKAAVYTLLVGLIRRTELPQVCSADSVSLEHIKKILIYLSLHCTEAENVTLSALSRQFGLSVPYLCRIFKAHTSLTLNAYVGELRCSRAADLIREGTTLTDAAAITGFSDYNYFSRLFKKNMGMSPSQYRETGIANHSDHGLKT